MAAAAMTGLKPGNVGPSGVSPSVDIPRGCLHTCGLCLGPWSPGVLAHACVLDTDALYPTRPCGKVQE